MKKARTIKLKTRHSQLTTVFAVTRLLVVMPNILQSVCADPDCQAMKDPHSPWQEQWHTAITNGANVRPDVIA